jgi:lysophospholipase L1-like esterase
MKFPFAICLLLLTVSLVAAEPRSREKGLFDFRDGDRVVFLGSGFIERLQNTGYLETMLTAAMPTKNITFRNLGWSGDTVWGDARALFGSRADGFKRLLSDVALCKPTVLIVCYGENEAHAGEAGLEEFRSGLNTLLDSLEATGARIVLLGPRQHEKMPPPLPDPAKYNADLRKYNDLIGQVAKEREHTFVDMFEAIAGEGESTDGITMNGIHVHPLGDWRISSFLCGELGVRVRNPRISIAFETGRYDATDTTVETLAQQPDGSWSIEFQDHALFIPNAPGSARYRIASWGTRRTIFVRKPPDVMELRVNGRLSTREGLAGSTRLSSSTTFTDAESLQRVTALIAAINEKNTLFFHRYRPQNETYLFLFRKHEQGNNAVEIPQFDPLIAELEQKIAELKKPVKQKYELIQAK